MDIISSFLTPALVTGLIGWFVKTIAQNTLTAQVQIHKASLDAQLEIQKAGLAKDVKAAELSLSNKLNRLTFEYQTRFSSYHQQQREVIGEVYGRLADAYLRVGSLVSTGWLGSEEEQKSFVEETLKSIREFESYYRSHRIYLDTDSCKNLDSLQGAVEKAFHYYHIGQETRAYDFQDAKKTFREAATDLSTNALPVLQALETKFRDMVTVEVQQAVEEPQVQPPSP